MDTSTDNFEAREIVYCHSCENEWYRNEHGLVCPACESDIVEILEGENDPREDTLRIPADDEEDHEHHHHNDLYAPDPDEDDIEHFEWRNNGPEEAPGRSIRGNFSRTITIGGGGPGQGQGQGQGGLGGGLMGLVGNMLQAAIAGHQQPQQQQPGEPGQGEGQREAGQQPQPGSPPQGLRRTPSGSFVHHHHSSGANYSYTITTTSNHNVFPRDANGPQPLQAQPDQLSQLMNQMFSNIGAGPTGFQHAFGGPGGGPMPMGGGGGGGFGGMPINIMELFNGGRMGDAVFSQEGLDRVITQLMEQHQSGNAPGPASDAAIDALPTKAICEEDLGENGKAECSICMEETKLGTTVTVLPCKHWFHHECIKAWLSSHDTCPHCRQGITPRDNPQTNRPREASQAPLNDMHSPEYQQTRLPGSFPFPEAASPGGAQSPGQFGQQPRRSSSRPESSSGNIFNRMRDAFGGGGSGSGSA